MYAQYSIELENLEKAYGAKVFKIKKKFKKSMFQSIIIKDFFQKFEA